MSARVLLVDDDPASRHHVVALLRAGAHHVDCAGDGFSGLRMARQNAYDLVLVDDRMPAARDRALARLMRALVARDGRPPALVAIADASGALAPFDDVLARPVAPAALDACVAAFAPPPGTDEPVARDARAASRLLWRVRGIACLPHAVIFPAPTLAERKGLTCCFSITGPEAADCAVVLNDAGLAEVTALRQTGPRYLLPVFGYGDRARAIRDAIFDVHDARSWTHVARVIKNTQLRTVLLKTEVRMTSDLDLRLLAYLFVSEAPVVLRRDADGNVRMTRTAGFDAATAVATIQTLAAQGLVTARAGEPTPDGAQDLALTPSPRGQARILDARMSRDFSNAG